MIRQGDKGDGQAEGQGNARTYQMDRFDKASNHEISKETREKGYIVLGGSSNERANLTVKWKRRRKIGRRMRRKGDWKEHKRRLLEEGREERAGQKLRASQSTSLEKKCLKTTACNHRFCTTLNQ